MNYYNKKKGQAAMEFLMTYGWAILAAIVVIAVLAIYFRPGNLVGQTSILSAPFTAVSQSISANTDDAIIEVRNSGGEVLRLNAAQAINVSLKSPSGVCASTVLATTASGSSVTFPYTWTAGSTLFIQCLNTAGTLDLSQGQTFNADIYINYTSGDGTLPKTSSGSIGGKIDA